MHSFTPAKTYKKPSSKNRGPKAGRRILIWLILLIWGRIRRGSDVSLTTKVTVREGENPSVIFSHLSRSDNLRIKSYLHSHPDQLQSLKIGTYNFSGSYSESGLITYINQWPAVSYSSLTLLEGRSMYDIDNALAQKGLSKAGDYIAYVTNPDIIKRYADRYDFLQQVRTNLNADPTSLEGFLYPNTYFIDTSKDVIDQLVYLQLEEFKKHVREPLQTDIQNYPSVLAQSRRANLSRYAVITLASIIEKEERSSANRPTIAGLFLNRIDQGMRLDADISLCYGLAEPYSACNTTVIAEHVSDTSNPYNTRTQIGLPPTPIGNPSDDAIKAVLTPTPSSYLYYLHDSDGVIHFASTLEQHNSNKSHYLSQ